MGLVKPTEKYSYQDYLGWEDRWELIDGIPYAMSPSPALGLGHQNTSGYIHTQLLQNLKNCQACHAVLATDWRIDDHTVVCPDNAVVCDLPDDAQFINRTPSIIFEVLSPSTKHRDRGVKFNLYQQQAVKYYVMVDPATGLAEIYHLVEGEYQMLTETLHKDTLTFDLDNGCQLDFDFSQI
ncbi:Uma2 family endonuclease [Thiomicrospira microaerophila]|uniref:Uma2 family endonuclease n=1 Tax=Thiomicrospira microaerophila TaxID=406020 RepID=UPI00200FEC71|nr:Uma2 family endonuclease [Thiomicrospira microaerophila]UQB42129.1 Uma2 family endonuclease [Thiomicrospira microaerophila]